MNSMLRILTKAYQDLNVYVQPIMFNPIQLPHLQHQEQLKSMGPAQESPANVGLRDGKCVA